jgi:hypothetical protein
MAISGVGLAAGLVLALPVRTGSVACPPAHEGRVNCLLQHAWAPVAMKVAAALFVSFLVSELVLRKLPALRVRWRRGERLVRRESDQGRGAVLADPVLAAANWGIVPEPARRVKWAAPGAEAALVAAEPVFPAPAAPRTGLRALTLAERLEHPSGPLAEHLRILDTDATRTRLLRRAADPALVVSCWSDAAMAKELDTELVAVRS